jgi:hypothetical protein
MNGKWMPLALGAGLAWAISRIVVSEARRRRAQKDLENEVRRWEDEGGYIPGATVSASTTKELS